MLFLIMKIIIFRLQKNFPVCLYPFSIENIINDRRASILLQSLDAKILLSPLVIHFHNQTRKSTKFPRTITHRNIQGKPRRPRATTESTGCLLAVIAQNIFNAITFYDLILYTQAITIFIILRHQIVRYRHHILRIILIDARRHSAMWKRISQISFTLKCFFE